MTSRWHRVRSTSIITRVDPCGPESDIAWDREMCTELHHLIVRPFKGTSAEYFAASAKKAQRWYECACTQMRRRGKVVPRLMVFNIVFYSERDGNGDRLAIIDVLNGRLI